MEAYPPPENFLSFMYVYYICTLAVTAFKACFDKNLIEIFDLDVHT